MAPLFQSHRRINGVRTRQIVGPYDITSLLGMGRMGEVRRARDKRLDRDVAIKALPAECANNEDRLSRFEREAQASGSAEGCAGVTQCGS